MKENLKIHAGVDNKLNSVCPAQHIKLSGCMAIVARDGRKSLLNLQLYLYPQKLGKSITMNLNMQLSMHHGSKSNVDIGLLGS